MPPRRAFRPVLLTAALISLLVVLGALQYRWSGQIGEAERQRMQSSLQLAVDQFRQDFVRELMATATGLQAEAEAVDAADWNAVAQAQAEWLQTAARTREVTAVYLLLPAEKEPLRLLNPAQGTYDSAAVPAALRPLITRIQSSFDERRPGPPRNLAWALDGAGPYLIHALSSNSRPLERPGPGPPPERRAALQIVQLNREYLASKLLPELAARHFASPDGFVYQTQVYATGAQRSLIYNSSGAAVLPESPPDLEADLIELRPRGGDRDRGLERGPDHGPERGPRPRPFAFRNWPRGEGRGRPFDQQRGFGLPLLVSDGVAPWKVAVRHPAGSVAAAVQSLRWRNLAISFAILLVLGLSMITMVRNTQRAQRLAELQMNFVAGVSHELRTPLAVISSAAENLTDGVVEEASQVKQYGSLIRNESRRLSGMMEQILQFAAGQKRSTYKPVLLRMEDLITAALALSQTVLAEQGFTVECDIGPALPPVNGESGALTQCLQNLISNAAKYSGASRWIGVRAATEKSFVTVTVEDRGIGIEKAELPHLFDAFYRAKAVRSAQIHGTGLGLNLARSFARDAGGDLTVESTPGKGSSFTLRLPAALETKAEPAHLVNRIV